MTFVKICGVSDPKHARVAAACGADFVGIVFAPSRRQVTLGQAKQVAKALGKAPGQPLAASDAASIEEALRRRRPLLVGVFADQDPDTINGIAEEVGLDLVQLSGSEPWEVNAHLQRPVLKCMKLRDGETAADLLLHYHGTALLLLDPFVPGVYGGTGRTLDWRIAAEIARKTPTVLAGGLTPENVGEAVRSVQPWAVDVSSGIETDGVKDPTKIRDFIAAARSADQAASA
ncbi:MAG: phosphoribosylanthranilate isomerase [Chloroflexota bacterium]|nr:phosphoribosylanthranilate isomerase [Chloroflexota bacterium]